MGGCTLIISSLMFIFEWMAPWQAVVFKRTYDHILREVSKVSGAVDALLEKDPVQKEW